MRFFIKKYVPLEKLRNDKLIPSLPKNVEVRAKPLKFNSLYFKGQPGRLRLLSMHMTDLFRIERINLPLHKAIELRPYAERLIIEAMKYGDKHIPTMELADFWLLEKELVHKLFKVLVPRYVKYAESFTSLYKLPVDYESSALPKRKYLHERGILELKGNPLPPVKGNLSYPNKNNFLSNILLSEAKREYMKEKYEKNKSSFVS